MRKLVGLLAPIALSVVLFLVLYNNWDRGCVILLLLLALNLGILFVPSGRRPGLSAMVTHAKFASVGLIGVLVGVLVVEWLFPRLLPREYAEIKELTKVFAESAAVDRSEGVLVFADSEPYPRGAFASDGPLSRRPVKWHAPGAEFVYYGYEPNLKAN